MKRYGRYICNEPPAAGGGFLSGEDEPMHIHRHWIEPAPVVCCVSDNGGAAALNLVSSTMPAGEISAGAALPLNLRGEAWGWGLSWNAEDYCIQCNRSGLYEIRWSLAAAPSGLWPVVISLENGAGTVISAGANIGTIVSGGAVAMLAAGDCLRFVNRSNGALRLTELGSDTVRFGAAIQVFRIGN